MKKHFTKVWLHTKKQYDRFKKREMSVGQMIKYVLVGGASLVFAIIFLTLLIVIPGLPDVDNIENLVASQSSVILDRDGGILYTIHGDENRKIIPLEEIPVHTAQAAMAIEDDRFYEHIGIDVGAIFKAVCSEFGICSARGGSTITQQFVKNAFLSPERTYTRKLKEIILALQIESKYGKDEIMTMYLNRIPYGSSIYGVEVASQIFFGKPASELTIAESAILAAIPKAPSYYSPYGSNIYPLINIDEKEILKLGIESEQDLVDENPDFISKGLIGKTYTFGEEGEQRDIYIKGRVDFVLSRMAELGYISAEEERAAIEEATVIEFQPFREDITAPHFVMYVRELVEEKYGKEQIEKGGLRITTTINAKMQESADKAVEDRAERNATNFLATNAALVAMDTNNGQILAMVGSADYWNDEIDGKVNVALRPRLPGSSFKPIDYAAAFLQGYAPSTVVYDVRTKFGSWYEPENFDGQFRGPVTFRQALAASLNIPAVKATYLAGIPNVLDLARKMGIDLNQGEDWYGLSLGLGAGEARLIDMVGAYSIFANGGYKNEPVAILKIEDRNGNILEEYEEPTKKNLILDPQVAYLINDILSDRESRPDEYWRNQLTVPGHTNGAKTGTSNKKKNDINYPFDTWTMGYTRNLAAGVWAGNANGDQLSLKASGLDVAAPIWRQFMTEATAEMENVPFEKPEGIKWVKVAKASGKLPSEHTPEEDTVTAVFASFNVPQEYDTSYQLVEIDKVSGKLATEYTPDEAREEKAFFSHHSILPDNPNWENPVRAW
ncbi:penicillin-binding protein, partial [Patescibacteria group bacterium]|nr:penicillin-binding protein [Patescibacteria group bacterium]